MDRNLPRSWSPAFQIIERSLTRLGWLIVCFWILTVYAREPKEGCLWLCHYSENQAAQRKEPSVGHGPLHWGLNISQIKQNKQTKKNKADFWWATIRLTAKWAFLRCITSWKAIPFCGPRTWSSPHGGKGCETKAHSSWGWWIATDTQIVLLIKMMVSYQSDKIPK